MNFIEGAIYKNKEEQLVCAIQKQGNEKALCCLVTSSLGEHAVNLSRDNISTGSLSGDNFANPTEILIEQIDQLTEQAQLTNETFDRVLRAYVKSAASIHYNKITAQKERTYIPPSGKVIDDKELSNLIDASLDMWLTTGRFNDQFEKRLAEYLGAKYLLSTNSGSSANLLAVSALTSPKLKERRLCEGDEVITVAAGFPTTITPIIQNKLTPVFVDVKLGTYNIDPSQLEEALSPKTKAIIVAHTLGNPFHLGTIVEFAKKHNLWLIEDNCDSLGSKYNGQFTGTLGHIGTMSFYPAHHITMGEGGALVTNDKELYRIIMSFRDWGRDCWCPPGKDDTCNQRFTQQHGSLPKGYDHKYVYSHLGYNLKITDWQAASGLAQLDKLNWVIERRQKNFAKLYAGLEKFQDTLILPKAEKESDPSWFGFLISVKEEAPFSKQELVTFLEENGIGTRQLFAGNMLRQPAFINAGVSFRIRNSELLNSSALTEEQYKMLPETDRIMHSSFWIGVWQGMKEEELDFIIKTISQFIAEKK